VTPVPEGFELSDGAARDLGRVVSGEVVGPGAAVELGVESRSKAAMIMP